MLDGAFFFISHEGRRTGILEVFFQTDVPVIFISLEHSGTDFNKSYSAPVIGVNVSMYLKDESGKCFFFRMHQSLF